MYTAIETTTATAAAPSKIIGSILSKMTRKKTWPICPTNQQIFESREQLKIKHQAPRHRARGARFLRETAHADTMAYRFAPHDALSDALHFLSQQREKTYSALAHTCFW
uniref:Uncharacterized protein n=1 Tax=Helicotheca tamesis TaxID=374047 RepID=A0A7S2H9S3_9STRA|mmetsp:Transcript_1641/g.2364  ORF Transcript_1641/g.2364 Transcript_1641/m.2364 type:complete len:109 (+) Transcript_1641:571-897(+)